LAVLERGRVATNVFLRRTHNFALAMSWLPWPVLPKKQWPVVVYGKKCAITHQEHQDILVREQNPERRAYYELCWHLGGSQGDAASLNAEAVDWGKRVVSYRRNGLLDCIYLLLLMVASKDKPTGRTRCHRWC
jgi:hypothetical protein